MKLIEDLEFFNIKEDKIRTNTVLELVYIVLHNIVNTYSSISSEKFQEYPEEIQKILVDHLIHVNTFTELCKPIVYEWQDKSEEDAYNAWMQSNLRAIMISRYDKNAIVDESEGTN